MPAKRVTPPAPSRASSALRDLASSSYRDIARMEQELPREWLAIITGIDTVRHFDELGLPCSIVSANNRFNWYKVWHRDDNVTTHEILCGREQERSDYTHRCLERVFRTKQAYVGKFRGFSDIFVPILTREGVSGFLASGPFSDASWSAERIRNGWQTLTGEATPRTDAALLAYAQAVLLTPVLTPDLRAGVRAVLKELANALTASENLVRSRARSQRVAEKVLHRRFHSNTWRVAEALVDPIQQGAWFAHHRAWDRAYRGLTRSPNVVIALSPTPERDRDPLENLAEDHAFVVACSEVALEMEDTICGRAGPSVAYLLTHWAPGQSRSKKGATRFLERTEAALRQKGAWQIRVGVSVVADAPSALRGSLQEALLALDYSVHGRGRRVFYQDELARRDRAGPAVFRALDDLVRALHEGASKDVSLARERLIGDVIWRSKSSVASARAYTDLLYSRAAGAIEALGILESRVVTENVLRFRGANDQAASVNTVIAAFRQHLGELDKARRQPRVVRRDAKLDRAFAYIGRHLGDRVTLKQASKLAGYAPRHFSRLLRERVGQSFEKYLLALRVGRAKELLLASDLGVAEVGTTTGFRSMAYFHRAFRAATQTTPAEFRRDHTVGPPVLLSKKIKPT